MRYEIKYVFHPVFLDRILVDVMSMPYLFSEIYHERQVNNIYLDTPSLSDYHDAVNGVSNRSKTRVRWYGQLWRHVEHPNLEIKYKSGMVGGKNVFPLMPFVFDECFSRDDFSNELTFRAIDRSMPSRTLSTKIPSIVNCYNRRYFSTPDGLCRVTIDWDMRFYSIESALMGDVFCVRDENALIEIKFEKEYMSDVSLMLQSLGYRMGKNSKYVNGVNAVYYGEIPVQGV